MTIVGGRFRSGSQQAAYSGRVRSRGLTLRVICAGASVVALAAVAACSGAEPQADQNPSPPSSSAESPRPSQQTTESDPSAVPRETVTLALAGDIHFEGSLERHLATPRTALSAATRTLARADVAIVNLETSVGTGGQPESGKRYTFQAPPAVFPALAASGVDVVTMANNHALDFGRAALGETFEAIDAASAADPPLYAVGLGRDVEDAFRPAYVEVRGVVVAVIGATAASLDPTADPTSHWAATADSPGTADVTRSPRRLLRAVARADRTADVVVVHMHWGVQGARCPSDHQRSLASRIVKAGGDVVAGSHAHRLQGAGRLGGGYVAYGLGNYVWYTPTPAGELAGALTLTVRPAAARAGRAVVTDAMWDLARIGPDGLPIPLPDSAVAPANDEIDQLRKCAGLAR